MALATAVGRPGGLPELTPRAQPGRHGGRHLGLGPRGLRLAWVLAAFLLGASRAAAAPAPAPPAFDDMDPVQSADGTLQLSWGKSLAGHVGDYEMQLRHEGETRRVYAGTLPEAHVSGLPDGRYELRVRQRQGDGNWSSWSEPKVVTVEHHPMYLVWTLMALGALVFIGTALVVLRSDRGSR